MDITQGFQEGGRREEEGGGVVLHPHLTSPLRQAQCRPSRERDFICEIV